MNNKLLITGTVAFDEIETPCGSSGKIIGGAGTYIGIASSLLTNNLAIVSIIGEDFPEKEIKFFRKRGINTDMIEKVIGGKTFFWKGKYHENMINRDTITTELNVLDKFNPVLNKEFSSSEIILLGNLHPTVQNTVIDQLTNPNRFVIMDTMNFWMDNTLNELLLVVKKADLIIINDEEAQQLTSEKNIFNAGEKILKMGPQKVIIKKGENGSVYLDSQNKYILPAFPVVNLVDPTGAGDSYAGGIAGFLATKNELTFKEIKEAMIYGTIISSFCVENFGIEGLRKLDPLSLNKRLKIFKSYLT
ncbi:MAG: PfkB family carbohydrate kinase [Bacteroidota bacterium]|nr:PfkB family carbohydrate kinase [Bacteroidota bacterium]MED5364007.1 PfkB family carbohydrate kinase [Bacteroidota bacterium]MEE2604774.1 PfkB family carbohydrate kinase [Bacteroidota bacterium]